MGKNGRGVPGMCGVWRFCARTARATHEGGRTSEGKQPAPVVGLDLANPAVEAVMLVAACCCRLRPLHEACSTRRGVCVCVLSVFLCVCVCVCVWECFGGGSGRLLEVGRYLQVGTYLPDLRSRYAVRYYGVLRKKGGTWEAGQDSRSKRRRRERRQEYRVPPE